MHLLWNGKGPTQPRQALGHRENPGGSRRCRRGSDEDVDPRRRSQGDGLPCRLRAAVEPQGRLDAARKRCRSCGGRRHWSRRSGGLLKGRALAFGFSSVILNGLSPVVRAQPLGRQQIHQRLSLVRRPTHRRPVVVIKPVAGVIGNGLCGQIRRPCQSPGRPPVEADSKLGLASRSDFGVALAHGAGQAGRLVGRHRVRICFAAISAVTSLVCLGVDQR
jgi:hypothetical protein